MGRQTIERITQGLAKVLFDLDLDTNPDLDS